MSDLLRRKKTGGGHYVASPEPLIGRSESLRPLGETLTPLIEGPDPDRGNIGESKRVGSGLGQWMKGQLSRTPSVASNRYSRRSDLRLLLGVMGAPLAPAHVSNSDPLPHLSIKDTPINPQDNPKPATINPNPQTPIHHFKLTSSLSKKQPFLPLIVAEQRFLSIMAYCHHYCHPNPPCICSNCHHPPPPDPYSQSGAGHCHPPPPPPPPPQPLTHSCYRYLDSPQSWQSLRHANQLETQCYDCHQPHNRRSKIHCSRELRQQIEVTHPTVSSLIRRIAALESSLLRYSSSASFSLRDAAARTIQTHFRAFLVRRSRTLRQLKDLASIKSTLNALKSSVSAGARFDPEVVSRKAMNLLLKLDFIQGDDPMIRDGKRSIGRDLIRFMEFIDGICVERTHKIVKNARHGGNSSKHRGFVGDYRKGAVDYANVERRKKELMEKLKDRIDENHKIDSDSEEDEEGHTNEIADPSISIVRKNGANYSRSACQRRWDDRVGGKAKKNVSFVENENVYRVIRSSNGSAFSRDYNSFDSSELIGVERELMNHLCGQVEEIGMPSKEVEDDEEAQAEDRDFCQGSDDEREQVFPVRENDSERKRQDADEDVSFSFHRNTPVKTEDRTDLLNKRKTLKILS